ncbi:MAG: hypothetical protein CML46_04335 [Rhodobacteraceae bacterium]|nr:hypothetical protein [Paracoccaceae bacterium]MBR26169.1 hypothetical protein [Paracoccaceae bacterium]|tara:strand:- start:298 stop:516 length:219 start_codon:yes stop_codon:yes gene_type:complete
MTPLARYRRTRQMTQLELARLVGCSQGFICKLENGGKPSLELAKRIEDATNGAVQMNSWFDALPSSETLAAE